MSIPMRYKNKPGVYVIAEIGINHNGKIEEAFRLLEAAVRAGADGVKIQVRKLEAIYTAAVLEDCTRAEQGAQYVLGEIQKAMLTHEEVADLFQYARQFPVDFFATPFDIPSAELLESLGAPLYKIGSADFTNLPLLEKVASFGKPMILSTGMAHEEEIRKVAALLRDQKADFAILHCNSTYPASMDAIHLNYLPTLRSIVGVPVGYSGHERGYIATMAAVAMGATIIERHITTDTNQPGPDHRASLTVEEFGRMVQDVRDLEMALGKPIKVVNQGEKNNRISLAKSLVAARDLPQGKILEPEDLVAKSPAKGVSPLERDFFLGKRLCRALKRDDYLFHAHLSPSEVEEGFRFHIGKTWGVVGRVNDFENLLTIKPDLMEIHMTWRDLFNYRSPNKKFPQDLVVHAPEYYHDRLIDFTSDDPAVTEYSIEMLRKTMEVAKDLAGCFQGMTDPRGPRVVVHPGGHFKTPKNTNKRDQYQRLVRNLRALDTSDVRILVENMPPLPWYFGGQWYNTIFMEAAEIREFAKEMGWRICYDTSHAQLYCNHAGKSLESFTRAILDHIGYLHISDAKGATEEGLQVGEGVVDFEQLFAILGQLDVGFVPEIWQGHLENGRGFVKALEALEGILRKTSGHTCARPKGFEKSHGPREEEDLCACEGKVVPLPRPEERESRRYAAACR